MRLRLVIGLALVVVLGAAGVVWLLWDSTPRSAPAATISTRAEPSGAGPERATPGRTPAHDAIRPRPFAPTDEAGPTGEGGLLATVVDAEDRPIAGAAVMACDPNAEWSPVSQSKDSGAVTGADGSARVHLHVPLDVGHLVVLAHGHVPVLVRVTDPKQQRVRLEGEAFLRGRVLVNGEVPRAPMSLDVKGFIDPSRDWSELIRLLLGTHGFYGVIPFDTDAHGEFAVFGLTRGEIASIEIPAGYVFADPKPDLYKRDNLFDCDGAPILLELSALNVLTGRIVRSSKSGAQPGSDPPELEIRYTLQVPGPGPPTGGDVRAPLGGTFRIGFLQPALAAVTLDIWEGGYPGHRIGQKKVEQPITGSKDLGDILLDDPVTVSFLMTEKGGQPVPKGRVLAAGVVSPETGTDGRTKLGIYPGTRAVVVGAPGYRIDGVRLPESLPSTMDVRLRPASRIIVRVRHEDPSESLRGLRIAVSYGLDEVGAAAENSREFGEVRGDQSSEGSGGQGSFSSGPGDYGRASFGNQTHVYDVKPGHDVTVSGFKVGDEVKVRIEDRYGHVLLEETVRLGDEETKAMEMVVRSLPRTLRGTIVDDQHRPIANARVQLSQGPGFPFGPEIRCGSTGAFEIADVYPDEPILLASAPGRVPKRVGPSDVLQSPTVVLEAGRQLSVRLTGTSSGSMHGNVTFEVQGGETFTAMQRGEDVYLFDAIPRRAGTVRVQGRKATSTAAVGAEETRVDAARPE